MTTTLTADNFALWVSDYLKQVETVTHLNQSPLLSWDVAAFLPLKVLAVIFISLFLITRCRKFTYRHLKSFAFLIFLSGVAVYGIGFNAGGCHDNYLALGWRACMSSLEMFTTHSDLIEVDLALHHDPLYMTVFSIIHFLAVCVSAIVIIKLFGYQLYSWMKSTRLRLRYTWQSRLIRMGLSAPKTASTPDDEQIFVFWGVNPNAVSLAESIYSKLGRKALLMFVALPNDSKEKGSVSRFTFSHFFHFSGEAVAGFIDRLEQMDAVLLNAGAPVDTRLLQTVHTEKELYARLQLKNLGGLIKHLPEAQAVNYYFLSDSENENVEAASAFKLLYDQTTDGQSSLRPLRMYCHARRNSFNNDLLLRSPHPKCRIELVDSSLLSVRQLKKDLRSQPVSFVEKDSASGLVRTPYEALIIGFGEIGQDALRYLYEFASFMGEDGREDLKHFHVADDHLEKSKTTFLNSAPALRDNGTVTWWNDAPVGTLAFWDRLKTVIDRINQVIIGVDDDESAKLLLSQLCSFAYKYRTDLNRFQIQVRIKDGHYREQVERFGRNLADKATDVVRVFGSTASIFNYDVFAIDLLEREAKDFYYQYKYISNAFEGSSLLRDYMTSYLQSHTAEEVWARRRVYKDVFVIKDENGTEKLVDNQKRRTMDDDIEVHYQEEQDYSNAWHAYTKCALVGIEVENGCVTADTLPRFKQVARLMQRNEQNEYPNLVRAEDCCLMDNLAGCEHLRWAAKMELLGFVYKPGRKSLKAGTNACIVSYADLKANPDLAYTIAYDRGVVELSILSLQKK